MALFAELELGATDDRQRRCVVLMRRLLEASEVPKRIDILRELHRLYPFEGFDAEARKLEEEHAA